MNQQTDLPGGRPFRQGLFHRNADGHLHLAGSRCTRCETTFFPPRALCVNCLADGRLESVVLSRRGTLHTFTVVRQGLPFYATPYLLGYVDLPEGVRVFAQLADCEPDQLRIGMEMEVVAAPLLEERGEPVWGYKFRPVEPVAEVNRP